jgi:hypothetical protein
MLTSLNDDTQQQIGIYGSSISKQVRIVITNSIIKAQLYNGAYQANMSSTQTVTDFNKIAFKYKENDFALWVNGIEVANDNVGSTFPANDLDKVNLTSQDGSYLSAQANVKSVAVFKEALTDTELAQITSATQQEVFYEMRNRMLQINADYYEFGDYTTRLKKLF